MNVLVLGWYHHRNAGDDRMERVLTEWLEGHTLGFLPAGRALPAGYARRWDAVLVGGGGVLQRRGGVFGHLDRFVRRARVPVGLVGVSAEAAPDDLAAELRAAADRCTVLWFRDRGSLEALGLGAHPRALVGPDLTWLRPVEADPAVVPARTGVAVATAPHAGLDPVAWRPALGALPAPLRPWPFWFEHGADRRALGELLPGATVPAHHDPSPAHQAAVVVSARYHGLVFGLQLGRPVVGVGDAPKVRRLLEEAGLGRCWVPADRPDHLAEVVSAHLEDLAAADQEAGQVAARLRADAAACGEEVRRRLEAAARPLDGRRPWRRLVPGALPRPPG